jgi:predicted DNA-binding protein
VLLVYYVYTTGTEEEMGDQLVIRIDRKTKEKFYELARMEGKSASEKVREMVETYIRTMDIGSVVDSLWERIGSKMKEEGIGEDDVEQAIREVRASR